MSDFNSQHNRAVWFDIPVVDLDRAAGFYGAVLDIKIHKEKFNGTRFAVLDHKDGNGGCLIPRADEVASGSGILLYLNVDGRIRDAVSKVAPNGGKIVEDTTAIGPHGFRALVIDSEGNRIALHSNSDG